MNPLVAGERFRYFGPDFDGSVIEIQSQMASWSRESGSSNERAHLAARGGTNCARSFAGTRLRITAVLIGFESVNSI